VAKLPTRESLGQAPSGRSGRSIATYDVSAIGKGAQALGRGIAQFGDAFESIDRHNEANEEFETEKRFQEFKFNQELQLDKQMHDMQPGQADGFADAWSEGYKKSGKEFYATVPDKLKSKYDLRLFEVERGGYRSAATFGRTEQKRVAVAGLEDFGKRYAPKPGNLDAGKADYEALLDKTPFLTPIEKDEFRRKGFGALEEIYTDNLIETGDDPWEIRRQLGFGGPEPKPDTNVNPEVRAKPVSGAAAVPTINPLARAVEQVESGGKADAVSGKGAIGLMQVMPETAREIAAEIDPDAAGLEDADLKAYLKDPEVSRKYGTHYLEKMLAQYGGDKEAALIAYNGGPSRADAWLKAGRDDKVIPKESADYYKKVLAQEGKGEDNLVSFTDYARGKGGKSQPQLGGAETGYAAARKLGIEPMYNQGRELGLEDAPLTTVKSQSGASFTVAAPVARQFEGFINELEASGYNIKPETSGGYNDRNIAGTGTKSQHAHGAAIDINWQDNKFDEKGTNDLPANVGEIANKWGLSWGGYFKGRDKDAMHFEASRLLDDATLSTAQREIKVAQADGPKSDAYTGPFQNLTQEQRLRLANKAEARIKQQVGLTRQSVTAFDKMAEKGYAPKPGEIDAIRTQVESSRDPQLMQEFREAEAILQWQDAARQVRPEELDAFIRTETDRVAAKGATPFDVRRIETADKLLTNMRKELKEDPLGWADRVGLVKVEPVDFSSPEAAQASLAKRIDQADEVTKRYGTEATYLRPDEKHALVTAVEKGGDQTLQVTGMIATTAGNRAPAILGEIFKDSPTAAVIGGMVAATGLSPAARDAADGLALSKEPGFQSVAPPIKEARTRTVEIMGAALSGMPKTESAFINTANMIYNVRARQQGLTEFDATVWQQGMRELIGERTIGGKTYGGIVDANPSMWGTRNIILPPYVAQDSWRDTVEALNMKDFEEAGLGLPAGRNGEVIPINRVKGAVLVQTGDGRYALSLGDPDTPGEERWVVRSDAPSELFELDFNRMRPRLEARRPDLFLSDTSFDMRNPEVRPFMGTVE
jgi:hypothetical protein